jgi:acetoin utilization deacetylase AcuC-like enzyme
MPSELVYFYPTGHAAHQASGHPERPERVEVIRQALEAAGWWEGYPKLAPVVLTQADLALAHHPAYLEALQRACQRGAWLDGDTYTTTRSWDLALSAAGGAVAVAQSVWGGQARRGLALTRPPGHHATARHGMGFCLLNNVALAAAHLIATPPAAQRLAIIDLDLHHGNGTQDIFWRRGDVLYISTHQSPLYPGTGFLEETGEGPGAGATANFPLPPYTGDQGFRAVMETLILPLLDRYRPQMLLVSVGFDTHWRDPLGSLALSAQGYGELIAQLVRWAEEKSEGKIALFLEGGYDLEAAKACVSSAVAALLELPWQDRLGPAPYAENMDWQAVALAAQRLWQV